MEQTGSYLKELITHIDFITALSSKIILLANNKLATTASELGFYIESSNIIGLKKKHFHWNDIIKNYTTLCTTVNNLISYSHTANYVRRLGLDNRKDKYLQKADELKEIITKFIENSKILLICVDYFSKNLEFKNYNEEIKNMQDVHNLLTKSLELLISRFGVYSEIFMAHFPEHYIKDDEFLEKTGGMFNDEQYDMKIIIGGNTEIEEIIGGFHVENYVKQKYIEYQMIKKDIELLLKKSDNEKIIKYYNNMLNTIKDYNELSKLNQDDIFNIMLNNSGMLNNLHIQFSNFIMYQIPKFLKYHYNRLNIDHILEFSTNLNEQSDKTIIKYNDKFGNINVILSWNNKNINESIKNAIDCVIQILNMILNADINKIIKDVKIAFKEINNIKTQDEYENAIKSVNSDFELIKDLNINHRQNSFISIYEKISEITNLMEQLNLKKKANIIKNENKSNFKSDDVKTIKKNLEYFLKNMEYIVNIELALKDKLKKSEKIYDQISMKIYDLIMEISNLMNPDNKFTCIKVISLMYTLSIKLLLLDFIKSRFNSVINEKDISIILGKKINYELNKFYNKKDGLNIKEINNSIIQNLSWL